ncbi:hypothetical protein TNCV_4595671 [Trichonephila clavipes]|uniref:Uncharacterized protein n=1 Tax=Trichonephila clavipes TaxID=2585209 RepID=A0A8X7BJV3_TRICX|nr:hypothetical protein TNCV_4595671 [Trichonephila clavipes]
MRALVIDGILNLVQVTRKTSELVPQAPNIHTLLAWMAEFPNVSTDDHYTIAVTRPAVQKEPIYVKCVNAQCLPIGVMGSKK